MVKEKIIVNICFRQRSRKLPGSCRLVCHNNIDRAVAIEVSHGYCNGATTAGALC